jgi:hypothetical protein
VIPKTGNHCDQIAIGCRAGGIHRPSTGFSAFGDVLITHKSNRKLSFNGIFSNFWHFEWLYV